MIIITKNPQLQGVSSSMVKVNTLSLRKKHKFTTYLFIK